uniref:Uncharacterized protein n=1 Tax=Rhizophora mucronata TaxID=61149 RepID=A0A2P2PKV7_RHIMU
MTFNFLRLEDNKKNISSQKHVF